MFLVGRSIPEHIRSLPQTVLNTPFGQMIKPQIEIALRGVTQGEDAGTNIFQPLARQEAQAPAGATNGSIEAPALKGYVRNVSNLRELEEQLATALNSCAVIFFTSSTCPPCKIVYPTYDELAEEAGDKAVLIKVDINHAYDVASKYRVRATPTFMTFLRGRKEDEWSGADPAQLRGNVRLLIQMAFPVHPHRQLRLPNLQRKITSYVQYTKVPPLDKLLQKIGVYGEDPTIKSLIGFVKTRNSASPSEVALPNLPLLATYLQSIYRKMPIEHCFAVVDLVRVAYLDPRVSGFFAEESEHKTLLTLLSHSIQLSSCPYNLRIVMLQLACNLFTAPLYPEQIVSSQPLREALIRLFTECPLDSHANLRVVAASLVYNLAVLNHNERFEGRPDKLSLGDQVEIMASLLEAIGSEKESIEALHGFLFALGLFLYEAPMDGEVIDLCRAMGIADTVKGKTGVPALKSEPLLKEIGQELLGKGLKQ